MCIYIYIYIHTYIYTYTHIHTHVGLFGLHFEVHLFVVLFCLCVCLFVCVCLVHLLIIIMIMIIIITIIWFACWGAPFGRHYLSKAACLMRPQLFHACFVVSRITMTCDNHSPRLKKTCVRQVVLDKWFPLPCGDPWGTLLHSKIRDSRAPIKPLRGKTLRSPRPKVTFSFR